MSKHVHKVDLNNYVMNLLYIQRKNYINVQHLKAQGVEIYSKIFPLRRSSDSLTL